MFKAWLKLFLLILFVPTIIYAQEEEYDGVDKQLWFDYYHYHHLKPHLMYYGDVGYRFLLPDADWQMIYLRPSVRWKPKDLYDLSGGIGVFQTFYKDTTNTFEFRPWQGLRVTWPTFKKISFYEYIRLEERFNFVQGRGDMEFNLRFRFKIGTRIPIYFFPNAGSIFAVADIEWFMDFGQEISELFSNRTRLGAGVGYKMNTFWTFEFHYVWQRSRVGDDNEFKTSDNLIQFKVRYYIYSPEYRSKIVPD